MVTTMARALRLRRESARLLEAFREHTSGGEASAAAAAEAIVGTADGDQRVSTELSDVDAQTVELTARQIALRAQSVGREEARGRGQAVADEQAEVRRPAVTGGEPMGEGAG
jgi:hypothetical protein